MHHAELLHHTPREPQLPTGTTGVSIAQSAYFHISDGPIRIGLGMRPAGRHTRQVRRCLPHKADAVVTSTSRVADAMFEDDACLSAVAMELPREKECKV
jgi:hypothetical protein